MSSRLNSISLRALGLQNETKENIKKDSIIDFLQSSEIEFDSCPKHKNKLDDFNTGFGENNDLHFETKCRLPQLKTPLYQENYLREFLTEEEKAEARKALGIFTKTDILNNQLLTVNDSLPSIQEWNESTIKQLRKEDSFFTPITSFKAVFNSEGNTLEEQFIKVQNSIKEQKEAIQKIIQVSEEKQITSLGDVKAFLKGFNNGDNLHDTIDEINQEMLRFEKTGQITINS